jgi:hypothetical protein
MEKYVPHGMNRGLVDKEIGPICFIAMRLNLHHHQFIGGKALRFEAARNCEASSPSIPSGALWMSVFLSGASHRQFPRNFASQNGFHWLARKLVSMTISEISGGGAA